MVLLTLGSPIPPLPAHPSHLMQKHSQNCCLHNGTGSAEGSHSPKPAYKTSTRYPHNSRWTDDLPHHASASFSASCSQEVMGEDPSGKATASLLSFISFSASYPLNSNLKSCHGSAARINLRPGVLLEVERCKRLLQNSLSLGLKRNCYKTTLQNWLLGRRTSPKPPPPTQIIQPR